MAQKKNISLEGKTILVTGSPGFIGAHLVMRLLQTMSSGTVVSFDNLNDYYDPALKEYRLGEIEMLAAQSSARHVFVLGDVSDKAAVEDLFRKWSPDIVVHLAAQAGVRYSIDHPDAYIQSNLIGFFNMLEACRHHKVEHLVYASSSSVYGSTTDIPFRTDGFTDAPVSLYAATKKSDELLAHSYAKLYGIPCTGLRFFTVYGPAGRPDMFYYSATEKLLQGGTIQLFNYGDCARDFTFIDDIVEGVWRVMQGVPEAEDPENPSDAPHAVYNIGHGSPVNLLDFIETLQEELVRSDLLPSDYDFEAHRTLVPMQPGDVPITYADTTSLEKDFGYHPATDLRDGLREFATWYRGYLKG